MNEKLGVVDLSLPIEEGMLYYPTSSHHPFKATQLGTLEKNGRVTHSLKIGTHCGTHIDAFSHFIPEGTSIDQLDPDKLTGPARLINLGCCEPGTAISKQDLETALPRKSYGKVVLRTDWSRFWNTDQYYDGWPHLTADAVNFLLAKEIHLLGLDFPSPDLPYCGGDEEEDSPWHKKFFENGVILVEYMNNLKELTSEDIFLMAFPLRLTGLDGSTARVMAYPLSS